MCSDGGTIPESKCSDVSWTGLGVDTQQVKANDDSFDGFVANLQPHCVIFDRFLMVTTLG